VWLGAGGGWDATTVAVATHVRPLALAPDAGALDRAAAVLRGATRPVVVTGVDARAAAACAWVRAFAESLPAPVVATWKGKGALADPHPLAFGVAGVSEPAAAALARADLVIALGLDDVEREALSTTVAVLDIGPSATAIAGDVGAVLAELASRLAGAHADWDVAELDRWKRRLDARRAGGAAVRAAALAREAMPAGTVAAFEARLLPAAAAWDCVSPAELHVPSRSAFVGFAVPAAIAAALAQPPVAALAFTDAAGFAASRAALATLAASGVSVGVIVTGEVPLPRAATDGVVRAATESVLAVTLARVLAERRASVIDATAWL
jgi:acetolactate synthase-1/2/3 large subunit